MKYTCSCCGYKTLEQPAGGTYDICELCGWEDDAVQNANPDYEVGANGICLREAQLEFVNSCADASNYIKDTEWVLLEPLSKTSHIKNNRTNFIVNKDGEAKNA